MRNRLVATTVIVTALILAFAACGGGSPASPGGGGGNDGTIAATIIIDATGSVTAQTKDVTVPVGSRVTFTNNHSTGHQMNSDPHPEHTTCPSLNTVGFVSPNQSRTSSNLNTAMVCTYHDHNDDTNANLKGTIRVQ